MNLNSAPAHACVCLAPLLLALLLLASCDRFAARGDGSFKLPRGSFAYAKLKGPRSAAPAFYRFSGAYPPRWPEGFELPPDSSLQNSPEILVINHTKPTGEPSGTQGYRVDAVAPGTAEELVEHFKQQYAAAGLRINVLNETGGGSYGGVTSKGRYNFAIAPDRSAPIIILETSVYKDTDLGGFTLYSIGIAPGE